MKIEFNEHPDRQRESKGSSHNSSLRSEQILSFMRKKMNLVNNYSRTGETSSKTQQVQTPEVVALLEFRKKHLS